MVKAVAVNCADTPSATWGFVYDGDGTRVKELYVAGSTATTTYYYGGGSYEVVEGANTSFKKYYAIAGQTVAMVDGSGLSYFLTDHLSSVMAVLSASGTLLSEQRYMPFGQARTDVGTISQTDFGYTGQRGLVELGLLDYKARFYDPYNTQYLSPDSVVPDHYNSQDLNRYAYVRNNPIKYTDPTGHECVKWSGDHCTKHDDKIISSITPSTERKNTDELSLSDEGLEFIKDWETYQPDLYDTDGGGNCTIGYGHLLHTGKCNDADRQKYPNGMSQDEALAQLTVDVASAEQEVKYYVTVPLKQQEYDALVSFAYNVPYGVGQNEDEPDYQVGFTNSTLLEYLNSGEYGKIPNELNLWIYPLSAPGLITRRYQEGMMFSQGNYDSTH
jgi:RHS repeat-associated protein